jgi:anti-sigma B factor antagonist
MAVNPAQTQIAPLRWEAWSPSPGLVVLALHGELDLATVPDLELAFMDVEARDDRVLVVDLRPLEFLDLAGARCLVAADARATRSGRTLHVLAGPRAERLFALAGLAGLSLLDV